MAVSMIGASSNPKKGSKSGSGEDASETLPDENPILEQQLMSELPVEAASAPFPIKRLALYASGIVVLLVALYTITPILTNVSSGTQNATKFGSTVSAKLSNHEQNFSIGLQKNSTKMQGISITTKTNLNLTQKFEVAYSGAANVSLKENFLNLAINLPFTMLFTKDGNDSRLDVSINLAALKIGGSRGPQTSLYNSIATFSFFEISNVSYLCTDGILYSSNYTCQKMMQSKSPSGSNLTNMDMLFDSFSIINDTARTSPYNGNQCTPLNERFSIGRQKLASMLSIIPGISNEQASGLTASGDFEACISYVYQVPLNISLEAHIINQTTNTSINVAMKEISLNSTVQATYVTSLPGPLQNSISS